MTETHHITSPTSFWVSGLWQCLCSCRYYRHTRGQIHWLFCFALLHPKMNVPKMKGVTKCCSREGRVVPWLLPTPLSFPGSYKRRKRKSIIVTVMLLIVSILILVFGLAATTRTQNITVGGYYPGVIVSMLLMFIVVRRTDCKLSSWSINGFVM